MSRKKGDLPGPFVLGYLRRSRRDPRAYDAVGSYQTRVGPIAAKTEAIPPQGDFERLWRDKNKKKDDA